jgi:predicted DNA-binding transcriptional regulator AlpA
MRKRTRLRQNYQLKDPLLSTTEVAAVFKCHYTTLWRRLKSDPAFPRPIQLRVNRLAWYESEVLDYIKSRPRVVSSSYIR